MKHVKLIAITFAAIVSAVALPASAQVMVGGAPMYSNKDIIDNAVNSKDHTTLVAAVKAAGLVDTLKGKGPFTVFAPTNAAFAALPAGTVDTLLKPESKAALTKVLTYHVVSGKMDSAALSKAIDAGGGKATLTTVSGGTLGRDQERQHDHTERRVGRHGPRDDRRRRAVERRDPRRRQGAAAEVRRLSSTRSKAACGPLFSRRLERRAVSSPTSRPPISRQRLDSP